jgi:PleD family two-component response regulator
VVERADAALYLAKDSGRDNVKSEKDVESVKIGA